MLNCVILLKCQQKIIHASSANDLLLFQLISLRVSRADIRQISFNCKWGIRTWLGLDLALSGSIIHSLLWSWT